MNVGELIVHLQKFDSSLPVVLRGFGYNGEDEYNIEEELTEDKIQEGSGWSSEPPSVTIWQTS